MRVDLKSDWFDCAGLYFYIRKAHKLDGKLSHRMWSVGVCQSVVQREKKQNKTKFKSNGAHTCYSSTLIVEARRSGVQILLKYILSFRPAYATWNPGSKKWYKCFLTSDKNFCCHSLFQSGYLVTPSCICYLRILKFPHHPEFTFHSSRLMSSYVDFVGSWVSVEFVCKLGLILLEAGWLLDGFTGYRYFG